MTEFPGRGQQAPQFWDQQLKAYIDERDAAVAAGTEDVLAEVDATLDARVGTRALFGAQQHRLVERLNANQSMKVLIIGASTIAGYLFPSGTNTVEGSYQADAGGTGRKIVDALGAKYGNTNLTIVNAAVAGSSTRVVMDGGQANGHVSAIASWLAQESPDIVLLQLNSNDATVAQTPLGEYAENWRRIIRDVRRFGPHLLVIPPFTHINSGANQTLYTQHQEVARQVFVSEGVETIPVQAALQGVTIGTVDPGVTFDSTHPNAAGAALIADAVAAYFPTMAELATIGTTATKQGAGDWTDPTQRGKYAEWLTADGATRRSRRQPIAELDGWDTLAPPTAPVATRLRGSLACYDMVQGSSSTVLYDKSGSGNNAVITGTPTWVAGGGLTFSGDDIAVLPLDALNRLKFTPGRGWFTVRVVLRHAATGSTQTIIGRRGDAASAPFGFFTNGGTYSVFERGNTISMGQAASATVYEDWVIAFSLWDDRVRFFKNGALVGGATMPGGVALVAGDPAWPWTIGGRHTGAALPGSLTPQFAGTIQWVDLAQSYVSPSNAEVATLHTALKAHLTSRALTWA